ncbi:helix-turn-helix and ligand-binding sensor domain-containing protein [Salinimicrobium xinjiangense]|uniref:helix-turn-helix and ligand-binding sensor domain-containing protein n=1 Tax=Salinimicrobium xinjiangense TaxID=438596 RepID=UPI0003F8C814|nr:triple tyrosine motif-containing protein [Salinimicrobium xinjiangense]
MKYLGLILTFVCLAVTGQEFPPVTNFTPSEYGAGNQNWMISQGPDKKIFVANNSGLLQFDGEHWTLYKVPGETAVRSVRASGENIYTGAYMEFGYWRPNKNGRLQYFSLKDSISSGLIDGEQFWDIKEVEDYVIFQSHQRLYSFNKNSGKVTTLITARNITNLFRVRGKIYYQVAEEDLYVIEDGVGLNFISNEIIENRELVGLFPYSNDTMLAVTRDDGLFLISGNKWEPLKVENYPEEVSLFSAHYLNDGTLALGSIGEGLFIFDLNGSVRYHLSQPTLLNNTLLSVMEDEEGNIWGGLDNGIVVINKESPFRIFVDTFGKIGTVYGSEVVDGITYLGTNQGLYYKDAGSEGTYNLIAGTTGQVWSLNYINGVLYAGHDKGTFMVQGRNASLIWDGLGTWTVRPIGDGIIQGHYNGLSYLPDTLITAKAQYLQNFDLSVQNMVVENDSTLWISHYHRGIFRLTLEKDYSGVRTMENYGLNGKSELGPQIFQIEDEIYYSTEDIIYKFDRNSNKFTSSNELNELSEGNSRISGASRVLADGSWWTFGRDNLYYVTRDPFEQKFISRQVPLPLEYRNISKGFENISLVGKDKYLVGSNGGYIEFSVPLNKIPAGEILLSAVGTASQRENFEFKPLLNSELELGSNINNIIFLYGIPNYQALSKTEYIYRLKNYSSSWSGWSNSGTTRFENLPAGNYTFELKGRINDKETEILTYSFSIARPWYYNNLAFLSYFILFLLGLAGIHYSYRRRHKNIIKAREKNLRMKNLEAEQEIIRLQKEHLERDMAEKNGQLAASTMSIIKKNEFLSNLKDELKGAGDPDVKKVIKTIDRELREEDNWKMFKEAFKNADKEFFDKIKAKHPELTSNDLRLCAYLRLNLSSKEIAPLVNISVKSVEIKRYRLRKKMNLPREVNLTDYIMNL